MLEELIGQVKKLFSTKSNGARLVYKLTDRLHYYKQILLAASMILMLGYSQFRDHFTCEAYGTLSQKTMTNFCWSNGTTTSVHRDRLSGEVPSPIYDSGSRIFRQIVPHVGLRFITSDDGRYQIISHNYMRSIWGLLIVMAACSYYAQRKWRLLFQSEVMKALLNLPGNENVKLVKQAQEAQIHVRLKQLPSKIQLNNEAHARRSTGGDTASANTAVTTSFSADNVIIDLPETKTSPLEQLTNPTNETIPKEKAKKESGKEFGPLLEIMDIFGGEINEHNHSFDYYPNQLVYMLIARKTSAYKLCDLNLRQRLLSHSITSLLMTSLQCIIPWLVVGPRYPTYGWDFAKSWLQYTLRQIVLLTSTDIEVKQSIEDRLHHNTIDYELSAYIWPITTQCKSSRYNYRGVEEFSVQCTVPINEICSKLFFVIWWFTAINLLIEFYSLLDCLLNTNVYLSRSRLAKNCWPRSKHEARKLATFRYRHAMILRKRMDSRSDTIELAETSDSDSEGQYEVTSKMGGDRGKDVHIEVSEKRRKHLEAQRDRRRSSENRGASVFFGKRWYMRCSREICLYLASKSKDLSRSGRLRSRPKMSRDEDGFREAYEDPEIYQLLYLMYLRLGCSRVKAEQVIRMSSVALERYLDCLKCYMAKVKHHQLPLDQDVRHKSGVGGGHQLDDDYSSVKSSPKAYDNINDISNDEEQ